MKIVLKTKIANYLRRRKLIKAGYKPALTGGLYIVNKHRDKKETIYNIMGQPIGTVIWKE